MQMAQTQAPTGPATRRSKLSMSTKQTITGYIFIMPFILGFLFLVPRPDPVFCLAEYDRVEPDYAAQDHWAGQFRETVYR